MGLIGKFYTHSTRTHTFVHLKGNNFYSTSRYSKEIKKFNVRRFCKEVPQPIVNITIVQSKIFLSSEADYLGVVLDRRFGFVLHKHMTRGKMLTPVFQLCPLLSLQFRTTRPALEFERTTSTIELNVTRPVFLNCRSMEKFCRSTENMLRLQIPREFRS